MYLIDKNNRLHVKFINYYNFSLYKKLIKNVCNKQQYSTDNLTIILDLNTFTIISEIGYKLSFNKIAYNFENLLKKLNINIRTLDSKSLLILVNNFNNMYVIFGLTLENNYKSLVPVFSLFNHTYQNSMNLDLEYLLFFDKIDNLSFDKLKSYIYKYKISLIVNSKNDSNFPIFSLNTNDNYFLEVLRVLSLNPEYISDFDMIVIFKNTFFESVFTENVLTTFQNFYISGFNEKTDVLDDKQCKEIIDSLISKFNNYEFNLDNIYQDFDYIILSAEYVKKIINEIKIIMISNELNQHLYIFSIILNFFKNIY